MAMLLVVLAVSAPSLQRFFRGRGLDSEARRFLSMTRYGQSRAVSEGMPMLLWMDLKQGWYGLRREAASTDADPKAVEYQLGRELKMELANLDTRSTPQNTGPSANPNMPMIRFQPDGFITEISPATVAIKEGEEDSVYITLSRNRLNYEIHTNIVDRARR